MMMMIQLPSIASFVTSPITSFLIVGCFLSPIGGHITPPPFTGEPWFAEPIPNVTVAEGREATLPCVVENLGFYRLAWIHKERHILLTLQDRVITRNPRISIRNDPPRRTWWLRIDNVQIEDGGHYMCQVNTAPMKSQTGYLQVVVPPSIDEEWTSTDIEIREGTDVRMKCKASGSPKPQIHWRREHDRHIILSPNERVLSVEGENLHLKRTSRLSMGAYFCIASNGVQPSVSKRIMLNVLIPPMVLIPSQLIGASVGEDVSLICNLESNPRSITYWLLSGGILLVNNNKYRITQRTDPSPKAFPYKVEMELKILDLRPQDFGSYTCVAKNSLGETEGVISLYEKPGSNRQRGNEKNRKDDSNNESKNSADSKRPKTATNNMKEDLIMRVADGNEITSLQKAMRGSSANGIKENYVARESGSSSAAAIQPNWELTLIIILCLLRYPDGIHISLLPFK